MDPFSFIMTSLSHLQKSRDGVMAFWLYSHRAVDGGSRVWGTVNAASPGRQAGGEGGLNLSWGS